MLVLATERKNNNFVGENGRKNCVLGVKRHSLGHIVPKEYISMAMSLCNLEIISTYVKLEVWIR